MTCASSTVKLTLCVLNILCCIFAALSLSACGYALFKYEGSEAIKIPCISALVLNTILLLNTILGCYGASRESVGFTWTYSTIMLLLLMGQTILIILNPVNFRSIAEEVITKMWKSDIKSKYIMTMFEIKYRCCGKFGPTDYEEIGLPIPLSCYPDNNRTQASLFTAGCATRLSDMYAYNQQIEEISDWTLICLEGATSFAAAVLAINFKNVQRRKLYH